jgi:serine/threonine protein kinase
MIHALITGTLPFDSETSAETIRMTLEDKLEFELVVLKNTHPSCRDLLSGLLIKDPKKRLTLDQAIKHTWFDSLR